MNAIFVVSRPKALFDSYDCAECENCQSFGTLATFFIVQRWPNLKKWRTSGGKAKGQLPQKISGFPDVMHYS